MAAMKKVKLSHIGAGGNARMVDVGEKPVTMRTATARATVVVGRKVAELIKKTGGVSKGGVIETARIAGILAAKRVDAIIPMCHSLPLDSVDIRAEIKSERIILTATASCTGKTGVEMEAMTAVAVSALTVYDMVKSAGKGVYIETVMLIEKTGGKSGDWKRSGKI